jgi:hypothetical protein
MSRASIENTTTLTRRMIMCGVVAMPLASSVAAMLSASLPPAIRSMPRIDDDPIFAAIEEHRRLNAKYDALCEELEEAEARLPDIATQPPRVALYRSRSIMTHMVQQTPDCMVLRQEYGPPTGEMYWATTRREIQINAQPDCRAVDWRNPDTDLSGVVAAFEGLREVGKIGAWGVSNFKASDMEDLFRVPNGYRCATNQVLYNIGNRRIEYDLLPWCEQHGMPVMAYSPLGGDSLVRDATLARIGAAHGCSATAVALAWAIRSGNVIAIPEAGSAAHVKENAVALSLVLTPHDLQALDAAHPLLTADRLRSLLDLSRRRNRIMIRPLLTNLKRGMGRSKE